MFDCLWFLLFRFRCCTALTSAVCHSRNGPVASRSGESESKRTAGNCYRACRSQGKREVRSTGRSTARGHRAVRPRGSGGCQHRKDRNRLKGCASSVRRCRGPREQPRAWRGNRTQRASSCQYHERLNPDARPRYFALPSQRRRCTKARAKVAREIAKEEEALCGRHQM